MYDEKKSYYALKLQCDNGDGCMEVYIVNSADIVPGQKPPCPACGEAKGIAILDVLEPQETEKQAA